MKRRQRRILISCLCGIFFLCMFLNFNIDSLNNNIHTNGAFKRIHILQSAKTSNISITTNRMYNRNPLFSKQICSEIGLTPVGQTQVNKLLDFRKTGPFRFFKNYKNPCFYRNVTYLGGKELKTPTLAIRCLPYFFIVGMPKSGTTDVWHGLEQHPGVAIRHGKEPMYFTRRRYPRANWSLDQYLDHFDTATDMIKSTPSPDKWTDDDLYYFLITGEGTVDVSHDNDRWQEIPGNEDCNEPRILNAHYLYHLNPNMRLIFMMRDPINRVYSDYLYESQFFGYNKTVADFHVAVLESITQHMVCRKHYSERGCAYNSSLESFKARLRVGMYYVFLEDWYRVFPKDQVMVIKFEEYMRNRIEYLKEVFKFLKLRPLSVSEEQKQRKRIISNTRSKEDRQIGDMSKKTRMLLQEFYHPFNKHLSILLNDNKYMWGS
ncbi:carbohydrate sulfotransferase 15-like [Mytilus trossulus]|uniref:carbohydrate sulfotransferase 15-like n=1 Tax=Mytilus trossulus TaxID=6551 RepID=UPI003003E9D7